MSPAARRPVRIDKTAPQVVNARPLRKRTDAMYLFGSKIKRSKTRNKTARYRAKLKKKNTNRRARMLKG